MDRDELSAWLYLLETAELGRAGIRRLLAGLGGPQAVLAAGPPAWGSLIRPELVQALQQPPPQLPELLERTLDWLAADARRSLLCLGDADYPLPLLNSPDPPLLLYLQGRRALLGSDAVAVVGSRHPSHQGRDNALHFAAALSEAGYCIVSGLALGIDGAAHEGGLKGPGSSIAVLGTGLHEIYPRRHEALAERLSEQGLLVSEYALGMPALAANFPRRNRIIAGLARGCLVVEAALQSGSLITARLASEAGREVFAIPGSIHSPLSQGCHALLRQGAALVENAQEVLDALEPSTRHSAAAALPPPPAPRAALDEPGLVLEAMGYDPVSLDALMARGGWSAAQLSALLLDLELAGAVARLPGALFQRRAQA